MCLRLSPDSEGLANTINQTCFFHWHVFSEQCKGDNLLENLVCLSYTKFIHCLKHMEGVWLKNFSPAIKKNCGRSMTHWRYFKQEKNIARFWNKLSKSKFFLFYLRLGGEVLIWFLWGGVSFNLGGLAPLVTPSMFVSALQWNFMKKNGLCPFLITH